MNCSLEGALLNTRTLQGRSILDEPVSEARFGESLV
jgi:hypothetical protein